MVRLTRIFHPVGFGAFYVERHDKGVDKEMIIVYDCGSMSLSDDKMKKVIDDAFSVGEVIDLLFISHFHKDHISGIPYLLDKFTIKKVVIPYIAKENRMLFVLAEGIDVQYQPLILDTERYFKNQVEVIRVKSELELGIGYTENRRNNGETYLDGEEIHSSGISLATSSIFSKWHLIPFNYNYAEKINKLKEHLLSKGLDYEKLDDALYFREHYDLIEDVYRGIGGDCNDMSIVLFSGIDRPWGFLQGSYKGESIGRVEGPNCIYLGDVSMNKRFMKRLRERLAPFLDTLYTVQIPHHGSENNFSADILIPKSISVISHKEGDPKHPSLSVIKKIKEASSIPISVTEDLLTKFEEDGYYIL